MSNIQANVEVKRPGRPSKQTSEIGMKKGKPTWKPAGVTDVVNKEDGFRYRFLGKSPDNIAKKQAEGWDILSGLSSDSAKLLEDGKMDSGKGMASTHEKHDLVLARMPEDLAQARNDYYNAETERRTLGLTAHLKREIRDKGGNAPVHGDITISSRMGEQVID